VPSTIHHHEPSFRAGDFSCQRKFHYSYKSVDPINNFFNGKVKLTLKPALEKEAIIVSREKAGEFKQWMGK
jgi:hypothetical protein